MSPRHSRKLKQEIFPVKKYFFHQLQIFFISLTDAVGEVVIARGTLVTESPAVILATRALEVTARLIFGGLRQAEPGVSIL